MTFRQDKSIVFFDLEANNQNKILDIGAVSSSDHIFHSASINDFWKFLSDAEYLVGHNIFNHDLKYLKPKDVSGILNSRKFIDTLFLSPLLFPKKPYHKLLKDDKIFIEDINNPVNDSKKTRELFYDEIDAFKKLDIRLQNIYFILLKEVKEFKHFFEYLQFESSNDSTIISQIKNSFFGKICENTELKNIIANPIPFTYCLALINASDITSRIAPWILRNFPEAEMIFRTLRSTPCLPNCSYCSISLNPLIALKKYFGFDSFREFEGNNLQEKAVKAAVNGDSIVVIFPTGGGKSLTFQVPALMVGDNENALTVVISPLVALMKDQVDNLEAKHITCAATINGLLNPIERAKSIERVADGGTNLLYISPEALRSNTIFNLLVNRKVARFVIDEAHCFSSWGHDFRIDYQYIGDFIQELVKVKQLDKMIPVSCFTATAKINVIEDIKEYFKERLGLDLKEFSTSTQRKNLHYEIYGENTDAEKFNKLVSLVEDNDPSIVYVSRVKKAQSVAEKLTKAGYKACFYHGQLKSEEKQRNQEAFKNGEINIMVATSAFGMGVDKADVKRVIHYDISDSIENYIQEAGRAGRDEKLQAECSILYNEGDIDKHFVLLNQTKLNKKEIQQIWVGIKKLTSKRKMVSNSALEIARAAGWDDSVRDIETRVTTAIAALEKAGYLQRSRNAPKIFATGIVSKTAQEAIDQINRSTVIEDKLKQDAVRIIKKLISRRNTAKGMGDDGESRVDYISDTLGIEPKGVVEIINLLKQEGILADTQDLTATLNFEKNPTRIIELFKTFTGIEKELLKHLDAAQEIYNLKILCDEIRTARGLPVTPANLITIFNFLAIQQHISIQRIKPNIVKLELLHSIESIHSEINYRHQDSGMILRHILEKAKLLTVDEKSDTRVVQFSLSELLEFLDKEHSLNEPTRDFRHAQNCLLYLSKIDAIKIEDGFLVIFNKLRLERLEDNYKKQYTDADYKQLAEYYDNKAQQIHIVAEYANKLISDYNAALSFVNDYFTLNYKSFIGKYFPDANKRESLSKPISPRKFREIFETVSARQSKILKAQEKIITVLAGPGSGKTKVLVHKMAAQLFLENIKSEQLLMLTFSRSAATEFKKRLFDLVGKAAAYVEIKTFHSYCFDLTGRMGSKDTAKEIVKEAVNGIKNGEIELSRITKLSLLVDEAQDISEEEFELIRLLMDKNEAMKLIVVGDDLQNIFEFRGSDSKYLKQFSELPDAVRIELTENYRSAPEVVDFANQWSNTYLNTIRQEPLVSQQINTRGKVQIIKYQLEHFISALVEHVKRTPLSGSTAIFTRTNEEASLLTGALTKLKIPYKEVRENDGFSLTDLFELRVFNNTLSRLSESESIISSETWNEAKVKWGRQFKSNPLWEPCHLMINRFEEINPSRKVVSEWVEFLLQSRFEDFVTIHHDLIYIMTLHKSKGREFENVFVLLNDSFKLNDAEQRLIYVGITRAKTNLFIHTNTTYFDNFGSQGLEMITGVESTDELDQKIISLTHKDVQLGYFKFVERRIEQINTGYTLLVKLDGCYDGYGQRILQYSKQFVRKIELEKSKGFEMVSACVRFKLFWTDEDGKEWLILLPDINFKKII